MQAQASACAKEARAEARGYKKNQFSPIKRRIVSFMVSKTALWAFTEGRIHIYLLFIS
jgi:hypothetical protein